MRRHPGLRMNRLQLAAWLSIITLAAGLRFYAITDAYVWYDEAFSVLISALSPRDIWFHTGRDVHPPLYYLLLHVWMEWFGKSPLAIRSLSAIAGTLTVALGMFMARSIFNVATALIGGLFLAMLPVAVRLSQEARMYAVEGLFLMGATLAMVYWMRRPARYRYGLIYACCMTAALYTHYFAVLVALAHWLYLIALGLHPQVRARQVIGKEWWACHTLIVIAYMPWLFSLVDLLRNYAKIQALGSVAWLPQADWYTLPGTMWRFLTLKSPTLFSGGGDWLLFLVIVVILGWTMLLDRTKYRLSSLLVAVAFVPVLALFCLSLFMPAYLERYIAFSAVALAVLLGAAVIYLGYRHVAAAALLFLAVVGLELIGLKTVFHQNGELGYVKSLEVVPMRRVFDYIDAHRQAADIVVIGGGFFYFSAVYYNGSDQGLYLVDSSFDKKLATRPNGYGATTLMYDTWYEHYLADSSHLPEGARRVWWMTGRLNMTNVHHPYRGKWSEVDHLDAGELELRLYQTP